VPIREGEILLAPAHTPHAPHRPADTWGLVIERKRGPDEEESLLWYCERCNAEIHRATFRGLDIEQGLKAAIERFDADVALRTCGACGHLQPEHASVPPGLH
jgi:3-hydroxyanthranilate 3,4-dioxygenase